MTEVDDTLAAYLVAVEGTSRNSATPGTSTPGTPLAGVRELRDLEKEFMPALPSPVVGIFRDNETRKVSILNGSHDTLSHDHRRETVLVFPDYKVVMDVPRTLDGAQDLWDNSGNPSVPRMGAGPGRSALRSWIIPYSCVILICTSPVRAYQIVHVRHIRICI